MLSGQLSFSEIKAIRPKVFREMDKKALINSRILKFP